MNQEEKQQHMLKTAKDTYGNIAVVSAEKNTLHFTTEDKSITYTCHNNGKIDESVRWRRGHKPVSENSKESGSAHREEKTKAKKTVNKSERHDGMHQLTFEDILNTSPVTDRNEKTDKRSVPRKASNNVRIQEKPIVRKRHRRTKAEIEAEKKISEQDKLKKQVSSANKKKTEKKTRTDATKTPVKGEADIKKKKNAPLTRQKSWENNSNNTGNDKIVFMRETPCPYKRGESVESIYSGRAYTVLSTLGNTARVVTSDTKSERFEFTICAADLKASKKKPLSLDDQDL